MAFDSDNLSKAAFKKLFGKAHTGPPVGEGGTKDLPNEAVSSRTTVHADNVYAENIPLTPPGTSTAVIRVCITGQEGELDLTEDGSSNGNTYFVTVPTGHDLLSYTNPETGVNYIVGDRVQNIIPDSFGSGYRPIPKDNGTEVPPTDASDWFLDDKSGTLTSETDLSLSTTGTIACYVYVGKFVGEGLPSSSTDNAIVRWDGTTGTVFQDSAVIIDDNDNIVIPGKVTITDTTASIDVQNTNDSANETIAIFRGPNRASAQSLDKANIDYYMDDTNGDQQLTHRMQLQANTVTATSMDTEFRIYCALNNVMKEIVTYGFLSAGDGVFQVNTDQEDVNFFIMTPNNQFTFGVDGGNETIFIGSSIINNTSQVTIDGFQDLTQLRVQANSTQNNPIFVVESSGGTSIFNVESTKIDIKQNAHMADNKELFFGASDDAQISWVSIQEILRIKVNTEGGDINILTGSSTTQNAGDISISGGNASGAGDNGGGVSITSGAGLGTGTSDGGSIDFTAGTSINGTSGSINFVINSGPTNGDIDFTIDSNNLFHISDTIITLNDASQDVDVRMESATNTNMFRLDAAGEFIHIGGSSDLGKAFNVTGGVAIGDSASIAPLNITERSAAPSSPSTHDVYLDDGTNTASTNPGWRRYTGAAWEDISAGAGGGGTPGGSDTQLQYNDGGSFGGLSTLTWDDTDFLLGSAAATKLQFRDTSHFINSPETNRLTIAAGTNILFQTPAVEMTLTANTLTFNAGALDPSLGWGTDGQLDITASTGLDMSAANLNSTWTVNTTNKIQFRDSGIFIHSNLDGEMIIEANLKVTIGVAGDIILGDSTERNMYPQTDKKINLGTSSKTFNDAHIDGDLVLGPNSELTIATGVITITGSYHTIDTESDAATDDVDTINGGQNGQILVVHPIIDSRTIVMRDNTGNLKLSGDFSMDNSSDTIMLLYNGSKWLEVSRSDNDT